MSKKIVLTGGGTPGHVTPNLALLPHLKADGWVVEYIGSLTGVEKKLITDVGIPYHAIRCGKLRRYFSWQNLIDPINILIGMIQSALILHRIKADVVFSKGGFVALPVVIGAYLNRIPVIIHESDMTPGLANRLSFPFAKMICLTFANTEKAMKPSTKIKVTGTPIRESLFQGDKKKGLTLCGFSTKKPCLLVMGGGQGSIVLNQGLRKALPEISQHYQVIHLCGPGKIDETLMSLPGYYQLEYADTELPDLVAASDLILSRAGANSLCEWLALRKPHILVPLSGEVSRGDQLHNAAYFEKQEISVVIQEKDFSPMTLMNAIATVDKNRDERIQKMTALHMRSATQTIIQILNNCCRITSIN